MKYRKYNNMKIKFFLIVVASLTVGCATGNRDSRTEFACEDCLVIKEDKEAKFGEETRNLASAEEDAVDREPASMVGDFKWLNKVQDDFDRIAAESTHRSVANTNPSILLARKRWSFRYFPDRNNFGLKLDNRQFDLVQTKFENTGVYAFAAEGQVENPITLSVSQAEDTYAYSDSGNCVFELSFWDERKHRYDKDTASIRGERCAEVMNHLRSYVP